MKFVVYGAEKRLGLLHGDVSYLVVGLDRWKC